MNDNDLRNFIGNKIRKYRKEKGLHQSELGKMVGVKNNTISAYERGVNSPEQNILFRLATALDVKVDDFFPERDISNDPINDALKLDVDDLDMKDLMLIKKLTEKASQLEGIEREKLMNSIGFAIDYFDKLNE